MGPHRHEPTAAWGPAPWTSTALVAPSALLRGLPVSRDLRVWPHCASSGSSGTCSSPDPSGATGALLRLAPLVAHAHDAAHPQWPAVHGQEHAPVLVWPRGAHSLSLSLFFGVFVLLASMLSRQARGRRALQVVQAARGEDAVQAGPDTQGRAVRGVRRSAFDVLAADVQLVAEDDDELLRTVPTFRSEAARSERRGSSRFFSSSMVGNTASKRGSFALAATSIAPIKRRCISLETWISLCCVKTCGQSGPASSRRSCSTRSTSTSGRLFISSAP